MMQLEPIPFNKAYITDTALGSMANLQHYGHLAGDGIFTKKCHTWLEQQTGCHRALLTHSCTAALEMAALLLDIQPRDEIIMPSYTFVSTANAFVLRGAVPVFIDIRADTLNLNEQLIEQAITPRTRAIVPVHYAGVACEMDTIMAIAQKHRLKVVEDAAQGIMASYQGKALGSIGDLGTYSFHATKNVIAGEGGCLLINHPDQVLSAEIIREKGTNRSRFLRGEVDKYTWQTLGSSFLPSELTAAFLWEQLQLAQWITQQRLTCWQYYHDQLAPLEAQGLLRRPKVPTTCQHNAHLYFVLLAPEIDLQTILNHFKQQKIGVATHYTPLHTSPGGKRYAKTHGSLPVTLATAQQLLRLPLWIGLSKPQQQRVIEVLSEGINSVH